ncbi:MAG: hypothetical protein RL095_3435 [Verrucomicrobiota bacterium]|jgi:hypothetical protein
MAEASEDGRYFLRAQQHRSDFMAQSRRDEADFVVIETCGPSVAVPCGEERKIGVPAGGVGKDFILLWYFSFCL